MTSRSSVGMPSSHPGSRVRRVMPPRHAPGTYEAEYSPVAVDGDTVVATGTSRYRERPGGPVVRTYENCFVMRFDGEGRCRVHRVLSPPPVIGTSIERSAQLCEMNAHGGNPDARRRVGQGRRSKAVVSGSSLSAMGAAANRSASAALISRWRVRKARSSNRYAAASR